jgi:hypothetical protein
VSQVVVNPAAVYRQYVINQALAIALPTVSPDPGNNPVGTWWACKDKFPDDSADNDPLFDNVVLFKNTGGDMQGRDMRSGRAVRFPGIQCVVRALSDDEAQLKIEEVFYYLTEVMYQAVVTVNSVQYTVNAFHPSSAPAFVQQAEKNRRQLYTFNGTTVVAPTN